MKKILQIVFYKAINDEEKLLKYAELAGPAVIKSGGKFLARGLPIAVKEDGKKTRTVVIEWNSIEDAEKGYNSPEYQEAIKSLDGSAIREFRYIETI